LTLNAKNVAVWNTCVAETENMVVTVAKACRLDVMIATSITNLSLGPVYWKKHQIGCTNSK
jgi:ribosomal protein L30E